MHYQNQTTFPQLSIISHTENFKRKMTVKPSIAETVLSIIRQNTQSGIQLRMKSPLFSEGAGLDSVGFLAVVIAVEQALDVTFDIQDLNQDTLSSVGNFVAHIERLHATHSKG